MSKPLKIGLMLAVVGLTGFVVVAFTVHSFLNLNHTISALAGAAVMAAMIILASISAYDAGKKANTATCPV